MKTTICLLFFFGLALSTVQAQSPLEMKRISVDELHDKIYAAWLGQSIGNIYGLVHENRYVDEPGPDDFPYGYDYMPWWNGRFMTDILREYDGAFSDDDTDFEYMYLIYMERYGPEPTYEQIAEAWKYHVRNYVWIANRAALTLMHTGFTPPATGQQVHNEHWFQIDPQLINEFWAVTAPGMIRYAVGKSEWAARITNDGWGVDPTLFYGAMYAAAFFESDVNKLIEIAIEAMPEGSRFVRTVEHMKELHRQYPADYRQARDELSRVHYHNEEESVRTIWNANLNGAAGILALLYGQGDFQLTLDLTNYFGFDSDNQAATMCGLLGVANGTVGLPHSLLHPVETWSEPFNDRYVNRTRYDLPNASIKDIALRTAAQAENIIRKHGGRRVTENGVAYLEINPGALFIPPLELHGHPLMSVEVGRHLNYRYYAGGQMPNWRVVGGSLPPGTTFADGALRGTPQRTGLYEYTLEVAEDFKTLRRSYQVLVVGENLAGEASEVLVHEMNRDWDPAHLERLRDGMGFNAPSYVSVSEDNAPKEDYYGYRWDEPRQIGIVRYRSGRMEDRGGWFTDMRVEYLNDSGIWEPVEHLSTSPEVMSGDSPYIQPSYVVHTITFDPILTQAVRVIGTAGGHSVREVENRPRHYTSVSELGVYAPVE